MTLKTRTDFARRPPPPPPTATMLAGAGDEGDPRDQTGIARLREKWPNPDHLYFGGWAGLIPGDSYLSAARRVLKALAELERQKASEPAKEEMDQS